MLKKTVAAALVAASLAAVGFAATAHASLFHSDPPAPAPLSFKDVYRNGMTSTTYAGKAKFTNTFAYGPSATLLGLRIGDSLKDQAPACEKVVASACTLQSGADGAIVLGLPDRLNLDGHVLPGVPTDSLEVKEGALGRALVGSDTSGRINAIVVPMHASDGLARVALQGFLYRFGLPTSLTDGEAVWDLPGGVQVKLVYEVDRMVYLKAHSATLSNALYAAVYSKDGAGSVSALLNADWSVVPATK